MFLFRWCDKLSYLYLGKFNKKNVYFINFEDCDQAEQCSRGFLCLVFQLLFWFRREWGMGCFVKFCFVCLFGWGFLYVSKIR